MRKIVFVFVLSCLLYSCTRKEENSSKIAKGYIYIDGQDLKTSNGEKFLIQGINLGNWLNPEGYMFGFENASSYRLINNAFCEMLGPEFVKKFWQEFQDNYITEEDIHFIKTLGMNSIRLPFHYKLFTNEDYMGYNDENRGFEIIDRLLDWCRKENLYVILDMHDAPGGQTGDNIDDSYGYPWLMIDENSKLQFCEIWTKIAERYASDTIILGYDLLNEPIAHYFMEKDSHLNDSLETLYKRCIKEIRKVDNNHIVLLGGAQWNSNFKVFKDSKFDDKIMYTCHRYWCDTLQENIQDFVDFRDKVNLPLYMGETGENTNQWIAGWTRLMEKNNIGWHYWPYKKMMKESCLSTIQAPKNWQMVIDFTKQDRSNYGKIREVRPDQMATRKTMSTLIENVKFKNCVPNKGYIDAIGMKLR